VVSPKTSTNHVARWVVRRGVIYDLPFLRAIAQQQSSCKLAVKIDIFVGAIVERQAGRAIGVGSLWVDPDFSDGAYFLCTLQRFSATSAL
jgi:hypothetical protein